MPQTLTEGKNGFNRPRQAIRSDFETVRRPSAQDDKKFAPEARVRAVQMVLDHEGDTSLTGLLRYRFPQRLAFLHIGCCIGSSGLRLIAASGLAKWPSISQRVTARPAKPGEGATRAPRAKTDQPIATIQRRAENRIDAPQSTKPGSDIGRAEPRKTTGDQDGAREGASALSMHCPMIPRSLRHARRAVRRQLRRIRPRHARRNGEQGAPTPVTRNAPDSRRQEASHYKGAVHRARLYPRPGNA